MSISMIVEKLDARIAELQKERAVLAQSIQQLQSNLEMAVSRITVTDGAVRELANIKKQMESGSADAQPILPGIEAPK